MSKTIAIIGSSRRNGNTGYLIDKIAEELNIEVIDLSTKNISAFDYEHKNIDDDFLSLMECILEYDNIIFASPVYWYAMSAQMKVFVDRLSDFLSEDSLKDKGREFRDKNAFVVTTLIQETVADSFINSFVNTFCFLGVEYGGCMHLNCEKGINVSLLEKEVHEFATLFK